MHITENRTTLVLPIASARFAMLIDCCHGSRRIVEDAFPTNCCIKAAPTPTSGVCRQGCAEMKPDPLMINRSRRQHRGMRLWRSSSSTPGAFALLVALAVLVPFSDALGCLT